MSAHDKVPSIHRLVRAVRANQLEIAEQCLKDGVDASSIDLAQGCHQNTALHVSCYYGNTDMIRLLLKYNADINARNRRKMTPLHCVAAHPRSGVLEVLLENKYIDLDAQTDCGWTALHYFAHIGKFGNVKSLLERGANPLLRNDQGRSALDCSALQQIDDLLMESIKKNPNHRPEDLIKGSKPKEEQPASSSSDSEKKRKIHSNGPEASDQLDSSDDNYESGVDETMVQALVKKELQRLQEQIGDVNALPLQQENRILLASFEDMQRKLATVEKEVLTQSITAMQVKLRVEKTKAELKTLQNEKSHLQEEHDQIKERASSKRKF